MRLISQSCQPHLYNHRHCFSRVDLDNVNLQEFPEFRHVRIHDVELAPGELLFLPVGWWHHVVSLDPTITLTFTHFRWRNDFAALYQSYGEH